MRVKYIYSILAIIFISVTFTFSSPTQDTPYVILISFDGFRWDYINRGLSPNLEYVMQNGVSAISLRPAFPSKTFPNHYTIVTGLYPENHGIIYNDFINPVSGERYKVGNISAIRDAQWYKGEALWETAERQGIICASYFWPGSEVTLQYRRPTYVEYYDHHRPYQQRIEGVINWLKLPPGKRPHFIMIYFDATDSEGHKYGPDSDETNGAIKKLDINLGLLINELREINMLQTTNIIIVSDHGMTTIDDSKIVNIEKIIGNIEYKIQGFGPMMMIDAPKDALSSIYKTLVKNHKHYQVYWREDVPEYYHFSHHPYISPIVIIAEMGWSLVDNNILEYGKTYLARGNHGYDSNRLDMHGIFYAMGPAFKQGYHTGSLWNIDIYPLICKILNIIPNQNIDGDLERIEFILNE